MLYYLLQYLEVTYQPPGFQVFRFITVRAVLAALTALALSLFVGRRIIRWLQRKQLGEHVRNDMLISHAHKAGTPTMGGLIILLSLLVSVLLWGAIAEVYVWLALLATAWMGAFGLLDDYIKTILRDKRGLAPRIKLIGQVSLGLIVGSVLYFHPQFAEIHTITYVPFLKDRVFDYYFFGESLSVDIGWAVYLPVAVFIVTAVSNAVNITDGLDGLAAGTTAFVAGGLMVFAYISGNAILADFLNDLYLPGAGELAVFAAAMAAACLGFLWYNGYPAQVFMGDTGALALGAAIGTLALMVKKELLLPLLGAVYFVEALSVIIQTTYFKYTRWRTGTGRRVFRIAPLHHHFEAMGLHESKIVIRFWIITALTVLATLLTLRIR
ncbi:MAG: phospho-N-acetylmuramoyl-pentapeptide-transferase [Rhodothermus sp.]|nr:phospho-N-acetylmuramoyl-pentapeptide-transferase [Rhodothermus sp.]